MANITEISDDSDFAEEPHSQEEKPKKANQRNFEHPSDQKEDEDEPESTPTPRSGSSLRRRLLVLILFLALIWFTKRVLSPRHKKPQNIYADRYSDEFKYRPAASPIITETLKDGRLRIRGAEPTTQVKTAASEPTRLAKKARKSRKPKKAKSQESDGLWMWTYWG